MKLSIIVELCASGIDRLFPDNLSRCFADVDTKRTW